MTTSSSKGPLEGVWVNNDSNTRSIPKIEISSRPEGCTDLVWWGRTHPEDSRYGPFDLTMLGDSPGDDAPNKVGYATQDFGFADEIFVVKRDGDAIVLESLTVFKDDSGRSNYHETPRFKKELEK